MAIRKPKNEKVLEAAMPALRDYIIRQWWSTGKPVRASLGEPEVRARVGLAARSNPSGWWGRAWTAVDAVTEGRDTPDAWMQQFKTHFRGLRRVANRSPYEYVVADQLLCASPRREERRSVEALATGQGRAETAEVRRAVEQAGMRAARAWLDSRGFSELEIRDTSAGESWDFEALREGQKTFVEAKGCRGSWSASATINVTRNEVEHARKHPDSCALVIAVWCTLRRSKDGTLIASSTKTIVEFPWRPDQGVLTAIAFTYRPRAGRKFKKS